MNQQDSRTTFGRNTRNVLWAFTLVYLSFVIVRQTTHLLPTGVAVAINITLLLVFAIVHGLSRYRLRDFVVFFAIVFVVSNIIENLSIKTGFPFGHYHYTSVLGPKLFLVPLLIAPGYFVVVYLSWTLAGTLLDIRTNRLQRWDILLVPLLTSFLMVFWDLTFDPVSSTLTRQWVWHDGGSYFGVPVGNFAGWFFCVFLFSLLFSLYVSLVADKKKSLEPKLPGSYYYQAVLMYLIVGLSAPLKVLNMNSVLVTDRAGVVWSSGVIYKVVALVSVCTMCFVALLCAVRLARRKESVA
ncbi:MAG: carotenoid biosynthesis protein [Candidatus Geothermincolia bacterium]